MIKIELEEWQVKNLRNYFGENSKTQTAHWAYVVFDKALKEQCNIPDVVSSAEVPAVRVRNYNDETGETEDGTVLEATLNTYLVVPDYNLQMTVRWDKMNCDVLR